MTNISAEYQRKVGEFVDREVKQCVSSLVYELAQKDDYMDDLLPVMAQDDWETPARDAGGKKIDNCNYMVEGGAVSYSSWQEVCEALNLDPHQNEAYEHWVVSDWLAAKLEAKGEMVVRDFLGLTIWGRTCSGQAILLDNVICEIYDELHGNALKIPGNIA